MNVNHGIDEYFHRIRQKREVILKDFDTIHEKWRRTLFKTNIYVAIFIFLVEFFMYFFLKSSDLIVSTPEGYFIRYLLIPTAANSLIIITGFILLKKLPSTSRMINYVPSLQQILMGVVVSSTHYVFSAALCVFCIPLFVTIIFSSKKITRRIGILCFAALFIEIIQRTLSNFRPINENFYVAEAIVAFALLIATAMVCNVLIDFQREKNDIIQQGYLNQLEMKELMYKDQKTGLHGHTIFMNTLSQMVKLSEKTNMQIALAIIDIDDFKKINDTYGHLKGDKVIYKLAELMKRDFGANRFTARFGGEEFAIIFTENEVDQAYDFLEKLRAEFASQKYSFTDDVVTISIGIANWLPGWSLENLFDNADAAMYAAKSGGKNRISQYEKAARIRSYESSSIPFLRE